MFMCEVKIPLIGSLSKKVETIGEGLSFLNKTISQHDYYQKAEVFDLDHSRLVISLRTIK